MVIKSKILGQWVKTPVVKGQDGYTPIKGVDYFTTADKNLLKQELIDEYDIVIDEDYVHTDNNYSNEEKQLLRSKADKTEIPDVSNFITNSVNDLLNYYLKSETYTKQEVNNLIGAISTIQFQVVQTLPITGESNIIYLVPKTGSTGDAYNEYIYVNNNWELIGSTEVDLTGYAKESWVNQQIADFLTQSQIETLIATAISSKQDILVSGNNIKTINNMSILGSGNIEVNGNADSIHTESYVSGSLSNTFTTHSYFYSSKFSNGGDFNTDIFKDILEKAYNDAIAHYDTTVDENIIKIFFMNEGSINILSIRLSGTFTGTKYCKYFQYASENCMQSQVQFTATLTDGVYVLSDLGYRNSQRNLIVLATGNTIAYTPTSDYNPATKKYVDDTVGDINTVLETIINGGAE